MIRPPRIGTGLARAAARLALLLLLGASAPGACAPATGSPAPATRATRAASGVRVAGRDEVLRLKHRIRPELQRCFLAQEAKAPGKHLQASVTLTFASSGRVQDLRLVGSLPATLGACLRAALSAWRLGPQASAVRYGPFVVRYSSALRNAVRNEVGGLRRCYNEALARQPTLKVAVRISFVVRTDGTVEQVSVVNGPAWPAPATLLECLRVKVTTWRLVPVPSKGRYGPFVVRFVPRR